MERRDRNVLILGPLVVLLLVVGYYLLPSDDPAGVPAAGVPAAGVPAAGVAPVAPSPGEATSGE